MKKILAMLLSAAMILSMVACNTGNEDDQSSADYSQKITIRVGEQASCKYFTLANEEGIFDEYFKDYNVEFEFYDFSGGPAMNEAFAAGELDAGILGVSPAISGISNDYGYRIVSNMRDTTKGTWLVATPDSGITSVEDLKGKKVGTTLGGAWQYILDVWLDENGLAESDIELINSGSETATAIRTNEIDAAVYNAATCKTLIDEGSAVLVTNDSAVTQPDMIVLSDEFAEKYPELSVQFVLALDATAKWINENREDFVNFYAEHTGMDATIVDDTHDLYEFDVKIEDSDVTAAANQLEFVKKQGTLADDTITVDDLFNLSLLEKANLQ